MNVLEEARGFPHECDIRPECVEPNWVEFACVVHVLLDAFQESNCLLCERGIEHFVAKSLWDSIEGRAVVRVEVWQPGVLVRPSDCVSHMCVRECACVRRVGLNTRVQFRFRLVYSCRRALSTQASG